MKLSEVKAQTAKHVMVFGGSGAGKTQLVGTLAAKYELLVFDLENGYETLLKMPKEWQQRVELIRIPDTRIFPVAIETMLKVIKGGECMICEEHGVVGCAGCKRWSAPFTRVCLNELPRNTIVVVDSLTQLTNSAIAFLCKNKPDDYKMDWDDWAQLGRIMDTFLSIMQQAPFHVVCISHETETEMEDGKIKLVPTAGTRNFSRNVARYFGDVIYCEVKSRAHQFGSRTTYSASALTKSRTGFAIEDTKKDQTPSLVAAFEAVMSDAESTPAVAAAASLKSLLAGAKKETGDSNESSTTAEAQSAIETALAPTGVLLETGTAPSVPDAGEAKSAPAVPKFRINLAKRKE